VRRILKYPPSAFRAGTPRRMAMEAGRAILRLLYPPCCLGCGARTARDEDPLCQRCLWRLERPSSADLAERLARLPEAQGAIDTAFALWLFDKGGTLQRVQHALKYGNRPRYGQLLGELLGTAYRSAGAPAPDVLVPIPLHPTRLLRRGYNQSTLLAEGAAAALGVQVRPALLQRPRPTRSQTRLSRQQRWLNVAGAFALTRTEEVEDRQVLLIDDVFTTGATAAAAALQLRRAGARGVSFAALALARS
jgi:ComF family protein